MVIPEIRKGRRETGETIPVNSRRKSRALIASTCALLIAATYNSIAAPEPLQRDTQTKALIQTELDLKSVTLTLGSIIVSDAAGIRVWDLGSTNGTKIGDTGDKMGFLGATPVVRPSSTTDLRQALINLGLYTTGGASPLNLNGGAFTASTISGTNGTFSGTLGVTGAFTGSSLTLSGNESVGGTLGVTGASTFSSLSATSGTFSTTLGVTGNTTLGGSLGVTGATSGSSFSYSSNGTVGGTFGATGNSTFGGTLGVTGALSGSAFSFSGNGSVGGTLGVTGTSTLAGVNATNGSFSGTLAATGALTGSSGTFSTTLGVTGNTTLGGTLGVTGAFTGSSIALSGNETVGGTLGVTGALTGTSGAFSTTLGVTGNTTLGGTLSVGGHTNVNGNRIKNVGAAAVKLVDYLPDNAVHDASVNYTTQLNTAIAAAVAGTRIVELPEWPVSIDATITVNSPVLIVGKGGYGPVTTAPDASRLVWAGGAGGVMMTFTTNQNIGGGLENVTLDGNGIAGTCLVVSGSSFGHYDYCAFINFTTGDGIKVMAGVNTASWNTFTRPYVDGLSGINQNGHSGIYLTGTLTGSSGTACHNVFIGPMVFHGGNRPGWVIGLSDNNTIISPFTQRQPGGTNAGFLCDPSEAALAGYTPFIFPSGNRVYHCQAGLGGWTQPATTIVSPAFIDGYNQDNAEPDPVTNGTPLYWTDDAGNFFGGQINGATITKGVGGASIDLGSNILGNKFDLYHSGNTHLGFGIATSEMRMFVPTGGRVAIGSMSTADGTTFTEGTRLYPNGGLNIGGTADPGAGNLILSGTITSSNAIRARAFNGADLSIPNNTATLVTLDSERWDSNTIHSTTTNTGRLTCVTPGNYSISGSASFDINATGFRFIAIRINGGAYLTIQKAPAVPGDYTELSVNTDFDLASTDYVELIAYQNSGGALNIKRFSAYSPEFSMVRNP